jgi:hypothetical protein
LPDRAWGGDRPDTRGDQPGHASRGCGVLGPGALSRPRRRG